MMTSAQKILIVDDRPENLFALEKTLAETNAEIIRATSGNEALTLLLNHDFAVAILDVNMPQMDGYELAGFIRGEEKTGSLPIIFLTAERREEEHIFRGYDSGAVDYIVKPYSPKVLLSKVRVFLELAAQRTALTSYQDKLEAMNRELQIFTYSVSHDLGTPLRAVRGFSQALIEDHTDSLNEEGRDLLQRSSEAAERMSRLLDDLLRLSRIGRREIERVDIDLTEVAREVVAELRAADPNREVDVVLEEGLRVKGDPTLLRQVMDNLLGNAWKFTALATEPRIEFGWSRQGDDFISCFVSDNGVGFDMKYAERLFVPFARLHNEADFPGSGIGLATVQRVIRCHGGEISAESVKNKGTVFTFTLPVSTRASTGGDI